MRIFKVRPKPVKTKFFILIPKKSEGRLPEHSTAGTGAAPQSAFPIGKRAARSKTLPTPNIGGRAP